MQAVHSPRVSGERQQRLLGGPLEAARRARSGNSRLAYLRRRLRREPRSSRKWWSRGLPLMRQNWRSSAPSFVLAMRPIRCSRKDTGLKKLGCCRQKLRWRANEQDVRNNMTRDSIGVRSTLDSLVVGSLSKGPRAAVANCLGRDLRTTRHCGSRRLRFLRSRPSCRSHVKGAGRRHG